MDKEQYKIFVKDLKKIRQTVVRLKGPLDGISSNKKGNKKQNAVLSVSNVIEKA